MAKSNIGAPDCHSIFTYIGDILCPLERPQSPRGSSKLAAEGGSLPTKSAGCHALERILLCTLVYGCGGAVMGQNWVGKIER